jgi:hypothetical protein
MKFILILFIISGFLIAPMYQYFYDLGVGERFEIYRFLISDWPTINLLFWCGLFILTIEINKRNRRLL